MTLWRRSDSRPRRGRSLLRRCPHCRTRGLQFILRRHLTRPISYDLRCGSCERPFGAGHPPNFWRWLKARYGLTPSELLTCQKFALLHVFGRDPYCELSWVRWKGVGIYAFSIKRRVISLVEEELRPLDSSLDSRNRRLETMLQLRALHHITQPYWGTSSATPST